MLFGRFIFFNQNGCHRAFKKGANDDNGDFKNFTQKEMFSTIEEIVPYTFKKIQIQELLTFCNSINLDGPPS